MARIKNFSHLNEQGQARMVTVTGKPEQHRRAVACGSVHCQRTTIRALRQQALPKGDVLTVAQIAGIQAAKQTSQWIPLCHPLPLHGIEVFFQVKVDRIEITATVETVGKTGVEMEALTAVSAAALTIYDMAKAVDQTMRIEGIRLIQKIKT